MNKEKNYTWTTVLSRSKEMAGRNDHVITHQRGYHLTSPELFCFIHGIFLSKFRLISNERNRFLPQCKSNANFCLVWIPCGRSTYQMTGTRTIVSIVARFSEKREGCWRHLKAHSKSLYTNNIPTLGIFK